MLYKQLFSILYGHLNLNQKRKKIEFGRLPVKPTGYQSNRPVYRSKPFTHAILNLDLNLTGFHRFPVSGQTGPVNRYRRAAV